MSQNLFQAPNYTQCPNILFDYWLRILGFAELKVFMVIIRKTIGWHKHDLRDHICNDQLINEAGLSLSNVQDAVKSLLKRKLITKELVGCAGRQKIIYSLVIKESSTLPVTGTPPLPVVTPPLQQVPQKKATLSLDDEVDPLDIPIETIEKKQQQQKKEQSVDVDENLREYENLCKELESPKSIFHNSIFSTATNRATIFNLCMEYDSVLVGQTIYTYFKEKIKVDKPIGWLISKVREDYRFFMYKKRNTK